MEPPMATLRLASDELDPGFVTEVLKMQPQVSAKKGDRLYRNSKSAATAQTGTWFVTTEDSRSLAAADHLERLLSIVNPHIRLLWEIMPDLSVSLSLYVENAEFTRITYHLR